MRSQTVPTYIHSVEANQLLEVVKAAARTYEAFADHPVFQAARTYERLAANLPNFPAAWLVSPPAEVAASEPVRKEVVRKIKAQAATDQVLLAAARRIKAQAEENAKRFGGRSVEALVDVLLGKSHLLPAEPGHPPLNQTQRMLAAALLRRSRDGWPTMELGVLVSEVGVKPRMLRYALRVLKQRGFVRLGGVNGRPRTYDLSGLVAHLCALATAVSP